MAGAAVHAPALNTPTTPSLLPTPNPHPPPRPAHPSHPNPKPHGLTCPPTRRAQRLSFEIWLAIREENHDLQAVLEASSTGDRLRLALLRLRVLREQVKG